MNTDPIRISSRIAWLVLGVALSAPAVARAQVFHSYPGATPVSDYSPLLGVTVGFGDQLTRLVGFGRFNVSPVMDLGVEVDYDNLDNPTGADDGQFGAGIDLKYQIVPPGEELEFDLAAQAGVGFLTDEGFTWISVPIGGLISRTFSVEGDREIVPFGGVYLVIDYIDVDAGSDTSLDAEVRVGARAEIVNRASLFATLHAGNGTVFFLGFSAGL